MINSSQSMLTYTFEDLVPFYFASYPIWVLGTLATLVLVEKIRPRDSIILTIAFTQLGFLASVWWTSYTCLSPSAMCIKPCCHVELSWLLFSMFVFGSTAQLAAEIYRRYFPPAPAPAAPPIAISLAPVPAAKLPTK